MSLTSSAIRSLKWSVLGEVSSKLIGPIIFVVLARILVPEDFGVAAAATVVISFSQVFWDAGFAKTIIQRQDRVDESATAIFWVNIGLSVVLASLLYVFATRVAGFFNDSRVAPVVQVLSLQLIISAAGSVHTALMQRAFAFKKLFWIRLITTVVPACASIPLAMNGFGYWSLIAGTILGQAAQSTSLWVFNDWRPTLTVNWRLLCELWQFGKWVMLSSLLAWFYAWADAIVVGHFLGTFDMGLYRTGNTLVTIVFGLFFSPLLPVLYSALSRAQDDLPRLRRAMWFVLKGTAILALPLAFGMFSFNGGIAHFVFGDDWPGVEQVIAILALTHGVSWLVGANGELYRAIGKPYLESLTATLVLGVYIVGYLVTIRYGLDVFLYGRLGLACGALLVHVTVLCLQLDWSPMDWIKAVIGPLLLSIFLCWIVSVLIQDSPPRMIHVLLIAAASIATYGVLIAVLERSFFRDFLAKKTRAFSE